MPSTFASTLNERLLVALESTFGTAATLTGANACRFTKYAADNNVALIERNDKTGNRSMFPGVAGRKTSKWTLGLDVVPNGAAGTAPDAGPFLQAIMGQAPTVVASTSVTYSLADAIPSLTVGDFRSPSSLDQSILIGGVARTATLNIGQDGAATWSLDGEAIWNLRSGQFSTADSIQKGGLSSFPSEPGSQVVNGTIIAGFTGGAVATQGATNTTLVQLRTADVKIDNGNTLITDTFGTFYASALLGVQRKVTTSFELYEDDSAGLQLMLGYADSKTPIQLVYTVGTVAGSIMTVTLKGVQLASPTRNESDRFSLKFGDSTCRGTGSLDELKIAFT